MLIFGHFLCANNYLHLLILNLQIINCTLKKCDFWSISDRFRTLKAIRNASKTRFLEPAINYLQVQDA